MYGVSHIYLADICNTYIHNIVMITTEVHLPKPCGVALILGRFKITTLSAPHVVKSPIAIVSVNFLFAVMKCIGREIDECQHLG